MVGKMELIERLRDDAYMSLNVEYSDMARYDANTASSAERGWQNFKADILKQFLQDIKHCPPLT